MEVQPRLELDGERELVVESGHRTGHEDVAPQWCDRQGEPDHRADLRAPRAGGIDDGPAFDPLVPGADRDDLAVRYVDRPSRRALAELDAAFARARDEALEDRVRIGVAVLRAERGEADVVDADLGEDRLRLGPRQPARRHLQPLPERERPLERDDVALRGDEEEVADLVELRIDPHLVLE